MQFKSFNDFYPFYLGEHRNATCRRLHFVGSTLVLLCIASAFWVGDGRIALLIPLIGYGFAWMGHFWFEHNRPATFKYPLYSLMGDWVMFWQMLTRKIPW